MRDYDRIYERIVRRGDEILERRRKKAAMIRHTSYAVSGMCAAIITGAGLWRITDKKAVPKYESSEIDIVSDITTSKEEQAPVTTAESSAKVTVTSTVTAEIKTVRTSAVTARASDTATASQTNTTIVNTGTASTSSVSASLPINTERNTVYTPTASTTAVTTQPDVTSPTSPTPDTTVPSIAFTTVPTPVITYISSTSPTTIITTSPTGTSPTDVPLPQIYRSIELAPPDESLGIFTKKRNYSYKSTEIGTDDVGPLIETATVKGWRTISGKVTETEINAEIYELKGFSPYAVAAMRFEGDDRYYLYANNYYESATLGELLTDLNLSASDISTTYHTYDNIYTFNGLDTEKLWALLTADSDKPNITEYCEEHHLVVSRRIAFTIQSDDKPWLHGSIVINPNGYLWTDLNPEGAWYNLGYDRATEYKTEF